ncbi:MAG: RNA 2',3'-cyclic phosphodiesterase [Nitrospiraceae bacterium]
MPTIRAFLALVPDEATSGACADRLQHVRQLLHLDDASGVRIQWVRPSLFHITVAFLGSVDEAWFAERQAAVQAVCRSFPQVDLRLSHVGLFPHAQAPRVVWLGAAPSPETDALVNLAAVMQQVTAVDSTNGGPNQASERFHPHLTLARIKEGSRVVGRAVALAGGTAALSAEIRRPIPWRVAAVYGMRSDYNPVHNGPVYRTVWTADLGAPPTLR